MVKGSFLIAFTLGARVTPCPTLWSRTPFLISDPRKEARNLVDEQAVWKCILKAIDELLAKERPEGAGVH